jgi:hypothetical protein
MWPGSFLVAIVLGGVTAVPIVLFGLRIIKLLQGLK